MKNYVIKVTKEVTEWWEVKAEDESDALFIYDISGKKILEKVINKRMNMEENGGVTNGWDIL